MIYRVVEKVTFEYVYEVEADSKRDASAKIRGTGKYDTRGPITDGEAIYHDEVSRRIIRIYGPEK